MTYLAKHVRLEIVETFIERLKVPKYFLHPSKAKSYVKLDQTPHSTFPIEINFLYPFVFLVGPSMCT